METEINEYYACATMIAVVLLPIIGAFLFNLWDKHFQKNHQQFNNK